MSVIDAIARGVPNAHRAVHSLLHRCLLPGSRHRHARAAGAVRSRGDYPRDQTCCGQPMANSGFNADCAATEALFVRIFPASTTSSRLPAAACTTCAPISMRSSRPRRSRTFARAPSSWSSSCMTSRRSTHFPGPGSRTGWGCTTAAARCARSSMRAPSELQRAVLLQADGPACEGRGDRVRRPGAAG